MSVQFGRWNWEGQPPTPDYIDKVSAALAPYGPDSNESYSKGGVKILYRAFHTTRESHWEAQPHVSPSGAIITWDGRLDNRAELIAELRDLLKTNATANSGAWSGERATAYANGPHTPTPQNPGWGGQRANSAEDFTDVEIVAGAYEKWGAECLGRLIGDWALSIWNPREQSVLLAKDPIGAKQLYYSIEKDHVTWSTILDPLMLFAGRTFAICEEYIAGWFATGFPAAHLTPYVGVDAVPPSCSVLLRPGKHGVKHIVSKYWDFDPGKRIRYHTDAEYEEHFRTVFATAVQRKLRSDRPVLAELSGGVDSSSIVCMADLVIARGQADCPRLDTITWYNESLPNWGELPHFAKVEEKRGRVGHHIDDGALKKEHSPIPFGAEFLSDRLAATPIPNSRISELRKQNAVYIRSQGYRVTLSGIGGGEVTGDAVPTPTPEFQNLLARARFFTLARHLKAWAAKMRKPRLPLLWEAMRGFLPLAFHEIPEHITPAAPWFHPGFVRRNRAALRDYPSRVKLFGPLPSFQHNLQTLDADRKLLANWTLEPELLREVRFPFLDRDLWEFMCAIPREQIVRVGQRRFLMKHALAGIVPDEVLKRKKKEAVPQELPKNASAEKKPAEWPSVAETGWRLAGSSAGIVDPDRFLEALEKAWRKDEVPVRGLKRTLTLESWLRHLMNQKVLGSDEGRVAPTGSGGASEKHSTLAYYPRHSERSEESLGVSLEARETQTPTQPNSLAS